MRDGCVNCGCTEENRRYLLSNGTWDYVIVAGWPMTYTTGMGGGDMPETGESITISFDVYAVDATRTDMRREKDETS